MLIMGRSTKNVHCDRIATTDYPAPTKPGPINQSLLKSSMKLCPIREVFIVIRLVFEQSLTSGP